MALLAEDVVEAHRTGLKFRILNAEFRQPLLYKTAELAFLADAGEVAFHVGHEAGYSCLAEGFGHHLQCYRFSSAGCSGDKAVAVGHFTLDGKRPFGAVCYV